jgi:broad specificity phosphatase PhoE
MPNTLIFLRHGQAEHNVAAEKMGDIAYFKEDYRDAPLTALGREQILAAAKEIAKAYPKIDLIYSSPLTRTIQTARCVAEIIPGAPITVTDQLIERMGGGHVCNCRKKKSEIKMFNPDLNFASYMSEEHYRSQPYYVMAKAENDAELRNRLHHFDRYDLSKHKGKTILIVTHHEVLNAAFGKSLKNGEFLVKTSDEIDFQKPPVPAT